MNEAIRDKTERVTVYLTPQNKKRLAELRRGEKTPKLNEALDQMFEEEERQKAFETFMESINQIKPVKPALSSTEIVRMLRDGKDGDLSDMKSTK